MPEPIFEEPRLVEIYDVFDGQRTDLDHYLGILRELNADSILDVGCGTGCFACLLIANGFDVTGMDPAAASIDFAQTKPHAERVRWIVGDATTLPKMTVDAAVMTGNVAQVFLSDTSWEETIIGVRRALKPDGHFIFEVRNPAHRAWLDWTRENTYTSKEVPGIGEVGGWCDVIDVAEELVTFRWTYIFESDGRVIESDSTLRFREREQIEDSLVQSGYRVREVRDAPDRPGKEFVFIASLA